MPCPMTFEGYATLITELRERGYQLTNFHDAQPTGSLIVRHDVDMSLQIAANFAAYEESISVRSTYFILVTSEFYNPATTSARRAIQQIADAHEVGLHFDATIYDDDPVALAHAAERECRWLEKITGHPIDVISFHRPSPSLLGLKDALADRIHAYQPRFFNDMLYCSDSRGGWFHGTPTELPGLDEQTSMQLLTHPIWWTDEESPTQEKLLDFLRNRESVLDTELARNCSTYRSQASRNLDL